MIKLGLMLLFTFGGIVGGLAYSPFVPVLIYHFFTVLRPQFIWEYSLSQFVREDFPWSLIVALAAIGSTAIWRGAIFFAPNRFRGVELPRFNIGHFLFGFFAFWIALSYLFARNQVVAEPIFSDYRKIFLIFYITSVVMISVRQAWILYLTTAATLGYIAWEINEIYLTTGYNFIYRRGFCGLDNNGAALLLSLGIPLCIFAWDGIRHWIRWIFPLFAVLISHAILLSHSRGAMLSSLLAIPFYFLRAKHRRMICVFALIGVASLPFLAGKEVIDRFASISEHDSDDSANSRKTTWAIAWRMAKENPLFGLGLRNSPLFTFEYGADIEGRVIHSTYLQIAADSGIVGLVGYAMLILVALYCCRRIRHQISGSISVSAFLKSTLLFISGKPWRIEKINGMQGKEAEQAYTMACGIEGSLISYSFGCMFLSLETFEPFYLVVGLAIQLWSIVCVMLKRDQIANAT